MCKDTELNKKNTWFRGLKEILYGLRPEVEPGEKIIGKHEREAIILVSNVILTVYIFAFIFEDVCSLRRLKSHR